MKTLKLSLKLYSTFHTDLLILKECDVAFTSIVKLALYYRVRGRKLNIFVSECREYRYRYRRAFTKEIIMIDDEVTILFLTTMIREKRRMAFVRSVLYDALICPPCGEFFKDSRLIGLESERLGSIDLSGYSDVLICRPRTGAKKHRPKLLRPTIDIPEWIPREWFSDPQLPETDGTASPPGSKDKKAPCLVNDTTVGNQERTQRKKKRRKKRKKPLEPASFSLLQNGEVSCHVNATSSHGTGQESEDIGMPETVRISDDGAPEQDPFPMLEEEDF